jgi:hypothetical protein
MQKHEKWNEEHAAADSEQTARDSYDAGRRKNCDWVRFRHERFQCLQGDSSAATKVLLRT